MRDQKVGILGLGAYTPDRVVTNAEWSRRVDTSRTGNLGLEVGGSRAPFTLEAARQGLHRKLFEGRPVFKEAAALIQF